MTEFDASKLFNRRCLVLRIICLFVLLGKGLVSAQSPPGDCSYYYAPLKQHVASIYQGSDDAAEGDGSWMDLAAVNVNIGEAAWADMIGGFRLTGTDIPANATIVKAELVLSFIWDYGGPTTLLIHGEDLTQNSLTFSANSGDLSNRSKTTASISEVQINSIPFLASMPVTYDVTNIVDEFVSEGWTSGDPMTFIVETTTGFRSFSSYEYINPGQYSTQLVLTYQTPLPSCNSGLSGFVFEDYNDNGHFDRHGAEFSEPGLSGVDVLVYDNNGLAFSGITDALGNWTFPGATTGEAYRVEYQYPPEFHTSNASQLGSSSEVSFPTAPECCLDFGLHRLSDYACPEPQLVAVCNVRCGSWNDSDPILVSIPEQELGTSTTDINDYIIPDHPVLIPAAELGAIWGIAYNKCDDVIYTGAKFMNLTDMGPGGTGAIYCIDNSTNDGSHASVTEPSNILVQIPNAGDDPAAGLECGANNDPSYMKFADKVGLGDVDLNETCDTLYAVNLNERSLIAIPVDGCNTTGSLQSYSLPVPSGTFTCSGDTIQPFGLAHRKGKVYVGAVCTAEVTQDTDNLWAYVYEFSAGSGFDPVPVLDFPLDYVRSGRNFENSAGDWPNMDWHPWRTTWSAANPIPDSLYKDNFNQVSYPQPVLSDITFDRGDMVLGFMDRFANQFAFDEDPSGVAGQNEPSGDNTVNATPAGEILRAGATAAGGWILEDNSLVDGQRTGRQTTEGANTEEGPGGGEFYHGDRYSATHEEITLGGLTQIPGHKDVVTTAFDPTGIYREYTDDPRFGSGGIITLDNRSGLQVSGWEGYYGSGSDFGKGNGFGDVEYICECAPLEIGNRVWHDVDGDGVQDPSEQPIGGVLVNLYDAAGLLLGQVTTDSDGRFFFNESNLSLALEPNSNYFIALAPSNFDTNGDLLIGANNYGTTTIANSSSVGNTDTNDSDAIEPANIASGIAAIDSDNLAYIPVSTGEAGENNFTYDFGFRLAADCELTASGLANVDCQLNDFSASAGGQIVFSLNPLGDNLAFGYSISASQGNTAVTVADLSSNAVSENAYGRDSYFLLPAGSAGSGDVQVTITDLADPSCTLIITVPDPGDCQLSCSCSTQTAKIKRAIPMTDTNWTQNLVFPQFDDLNGCRILESVEVVQIGEIGQMAVLENGDATTNTLTATTSGSVSLNFNGNSLSTSPGSITNSANLAVGIAVPAQGTWTGDVMNSTLLAMGSNLLSSLNSLQQPDQQSWWVTSQTGNLSHDDDIVVFDPSFSLTSTSGVYNSASDLSFFTGSGIVNLSASSSGVSSASGSGNASSIIRTTASVTVEVTYSFTCAPPSILSLVPGTCDPASDTFDLDVEVSYYCGLSGDIEVNGTMYTPDGNSPDTFTISGLPATGAPVNTVTVNYVDDTACASATDDYAAPEPCALPECPTNDCVQINVQVNSN